ncbi:HAMP domain-containing sensor histidine kinase [Sphingomonas sp.]|uniref:sensor histidine kinase n=1 Tax=Sphingomonas sp. TaxID=28214 RepID=UPI002EDA00DC
MRLSITARIALLSIGLAIISNFALSAFVWKQAQSDAREAVQRETIEQADALIAVWRDGGDAILAPAIRSALAPADMSQVLAILDERGNRLVGLAPMRFAPPLERTLFRVARLGADGRWAGRDTGYSLRPIGRRWLLVGRNMDLIAAEQRAIERALMLAVTLSLALGIFEALVLARYVSRRLDGIAGVVDAAGEGDLSRRVAMVAGGNDAFDRLAQHLNATLDKTEALMNELRVVTDSLAHDLRSPLSRLRTKTEQAVTLADPHAREAALGGLLVETDLVLRMLTMVIEISRSGSVPRDRFTRVGPAELVEEIAELYEPVVEDAGLAFSVRIEARPAAMALHRQLMSQAIGNLIDNAMKHAANGGTLVLRLAQGVDGVAIQVEDRGPGIAEDDRAQALKRFGRLDAARSTPGAGLGMALIEAVARLHHGRFELADNAPGLIARIVLPG